MVKLIRYVGFDPFEDQFDGVELAPLHSEELTTSRKTQINVARAWDLKHNGLGWSEIGRLLASEQGRAAPYQYQSVYAAANYAKPK